MIPWVTYAATVAVQLIGLAGLIYGALWLIDRTANFFWKRAELAPLLLEFWQWKRAQKPKRSVKVTVPGVNDQTDPHRPLD